MNLMILGPQGCGKGTQAERLSDIHGLNYFEAGKILRSIANSDNPKGVEISNYLNSGNLIPDEFMRLLAWDFINKNDKNSGYIFDGYPRSVSQFEHLEDMLRKFGKRIDLVIYIDITNQESVQRLSGRKTCKRCGEIYNTLSHPPKVVDICDVCGGELTTREDDKPESIIRRLKIFEERTKPVLEMADKLGLLVRVNGMQSIESVSKEIDEILKNKSLS